MKRFFTLLLLLAGLVLAGSASATTIVLSGESNDGTPASQLDAELEFVVVGTSLELTVTNTGSDFTINQVYWNAASNVTGLSLVSATHDVEGDVASAWAPVETNEKVGGFGRFDFALLAGGGASNTSLIEPGEEILFVFDISGAGPFAMVDFSVENNRGFLAAAKFVHGPPNPECADAVIPTKECPEGVLTEDSSFGAVPEPTSSWLLGVGLAALATARNARA
ncbi:MAG: PEP-CTERM sorting domain-containing protein [Myxococcota bacterium]